MVKTLHRGGRAHRLSAGLALAQDVEKGAILFKQCSPCHKTGPGATNGVGPELNGLDGRHSGSAPNYSYSDANKNSGIDGTNRRLRNTSKIRERKFQAPK